MSQNDRITTDEPDGRKASDAAAMSAGFDARETLRGGYDQTFAGVVA